MKYTYKDLDERFRGWPLGRRLEALFERHRQAKRQRRTVWRYVNDISSVDVELEKLSTRRKVLVEKLQKSCAHLPVDRLYEENTVEDDWSQQSTTYCNLKCEKCGLELERWQE